MGGGIAFVTASKAKIARTYQDINPKGINHALQYSWRTADRKVKRRHIQGKRAG